MNYFAHGRHFVDDPYFLAGTAVPDWLNVVDRRVRVRSRQAEQHFARPTPARRAWQRALCSIAGTTSGFTARGHLPSCRSSCAGCCARGCRQTMDSGRTFWGTSWSRCCSMPRSMADDPARLEAYYAAFDTLDAEATAAAVNRIAGRDVPNLAAFIPLFSRERFLSDYADDGKLLVRLNQVMRRVGLPLLPASLVDTLAEARRQVAARKDELLAA